MDSGRGGEADRIRDLADRGRVSALGHGAGDVFHDALSALGVVPGHAVTVPERLF
jgi:hypothetical protein